MTDDALANQARKVVADWGRYPRGTVARDGADLIEALLARVEAQPATEPTDAEVEARVMLELADRIMGPSDDLRDAATCRSIAQELRLAALESRRN